MERTIRNLAEMKGRVYVRFATQEGAARFLQMAEDEGFTFGDGVKPTKRECGEIMAINQDNTINFVGHIGAIAFQAGAKKIGNEELIRIDFDKYVSGEKHFLFKKTGSEPSTKGKDACESVNKPIRAESHRQCDRRALRGLSSGSRSILNRETGHINYNHNLIC